MINVVATIGLCLDIVGVVLLYFYGPPVLMLLPDGSELVWHSGTAEERNQRASIAKRKIRISKLALLIIIVGFALQLAGQFKYNEYRELERDNYTNTSKKEINTTGSAGGR